MLGDPPQQPHNLAQKNSDRNPWTSNLGEEMMRRRPGTAGMIPLGSPASWKLTSGTRATSHPLRISLELGREDAT